MARPIGNSRKDVKVRPTPRRVDERRLDFRRRAVRSRAPVTSERSRARLTALVACLLPAAAAIAARGWIASLPHRWSAESLDRFFLYGPFQEHLGNELTRGRLPGWNPFLGLGINDAADVSLGPLYPPNLLFAVGPTHRIDEALALAHIVLAATATFLLARRGALGLAGAAVGGVVLAAGVAVHKLASYASMLTTWAWCPVAFLAARRLGDGPTPGRALVLGVVLALQAFAGYLQVHLYTVLCLPLFFLPVSRPAAFVRPLAGAVAAELIALGLAAVTLVPGLTAIAASWRSREATPELLHHIFPIYLGDYLRGLAAPWLAAPVWQRGSPVYAGPLLVPLLLAGVLARGLVPRLRLPALVLTGTAVVLSLGDATPIFPLLRRLPVSHWLTGPYKWTYFAALGATLLAAVGAHALLVPGGLRPLARHLWTVCSAGYLLWLPAPLAMRLASIATVGALAFVPSRPMPRARTLLAASLAPIVAVTAIVSYRWRTTTPADDPGFAARYRPAYAFLAARQADGRTFVLVPTAEISPRQGAVERVAQFNTNGVIVTMRLARYMEAVGKAFEKRQRKRALGLLRALGARFLMTTPETGGWLGAAGLKRVFTSPGADVWRDAAAPPRAYLANAVEHLPADAVLERLGDPMVAASRIAILESGEGPGGPVSRGNVAIVRTSETEVVVAVTVSAPATLVLLDAWSPDWQARIGGRTVPIRHANWLARAVEVPAGRHEVVFSFVPRALYAGLAISTLTAMGCLAAVLLLRRRRIS
jgi:hypothetical protein